MKNRFKNEETNAENTERKNSTTPQAGSPSIRHAQHISGLYLIARAHHYPALFFDSYNKGKFSKAFETICKDPTLNHRTETTNLMLKNSFTKIDLNKKTGLYQQTMLHRVAMQADQTLYNCFVKNGADTTIEDSFGKTPAQYLEEALVQISFAKLSCS